MASTSNRLSVAVLLIIAICGCERKNVVTQTDSLSTSTEVAPVVHDTVVTVQPETSHARRITDTKHVAKSEANIRVEQPRPGARISGQTFTISGMSRTFENSISFSLQSSTGAVISSGHGMSNGLMGEFGPYRLTVNTQGYRGHATLEVFDLSAKDGSKIDVVRVPIELASDTIGISPSDRITPLPRKK